MNPESIQYPDLFAIIGPTASGKTDLAIALGQKFPLEVISMDSMMIYQGMDIGTAKPTEEECRGVTHHLLSFLAPQQSYSVATFVEDVMRLTADIQRRGKIPLVVGGTLMYFNALTQGLAQLPQADATLREQLMDQWQADPMAFHQRLCQVDPEAAGRIFPNDMQRATRALEVYQLTGQSLSQLQKQNNLGYPGKVHTLALIPQNRGLMKQLIAKRFYQMLDRGFLAECAQVFNQPQIEENLPAIRAVGYQQAWWYLQGSYDHEEFIDKAIIATRQLAKRQLTWLRGLATKGQLEMQLDPYTLEADEKLRLASEWLASHINPGQYK